MRRATPRGAAPEHGSTIGGSWAAVAVGVPPICTAILRSPRRRRFAFIDFPASTGPVFPLKAPLGRLARMTAAGGRDKSRSVAYGARAAGLEFALHLHDGVSVVLRRAADRATAAQNASGDRAFPIARKAAEALGQNGEGLPRGVGVCRAGTRRVDTEHCGENVACRSGLHPGGETGDVASSACGDDRGALRASHVVAAPCGPD